ncbi:hypothetical protein QK290_13540 [Pseudarthrobacter sp. AL07]|uniref:hypothetical protein n=1 Tax=unclassified Pseudarthrobacter TaxID=2647000 RepID=UPI002499D51F|nr:MULTISPECIES: hypothetical protein [unclassified Pseudarthrobacter]MDI3195439.1 hypothetical protein [Pseudarthrobacter sp. AL20]MDI3209505.1 hypothetical protein [Pseudarthrobacter sp. AL07]
MPTRPAAVMVHGMDGSVATLCLDLDTSKAHKGVLDEDAARIRELLTGCGLRWVEDFSPSGGRHMYIPLQERLGAAEARDLVEALALTAASLDPSPHQNVTDGCIRVPGSAHKRGGYQILLTPLSAAYDALRRRNPQTAVAALWSALAPELSRNREQKARQSKVANLPRPTAAQLPLAGGSESPLRRIARTGLYDTARYKSPSEARMAVLNHFSACRWTLDQVRAGITGQFPGLAALYGSDAKQGRLLETEWANAVAWTQKDAPPSAGRRNAFINDTSRPVPTGGAAGSASKAGMHQLVNDLENILYAVLDHRMMNLGRESLGLRFLFRSLLGYMRAKETDLLDVGCRTLATALGKHHATIARLLPRLVEVSDGIITKVADARRRSADVYLIQLPAHHQQLARELSWRKGKIYGIRNVFRALGAPAALVYEAIERGRRSPTSADIIRATGISRSAVENALAEMSALRMIHRDGRQWRLTATTNLGQLAVRLGVMDDVQAQIRLYRHQRAAWHAYLDRFLDQAITETAMYDTEREDHWLPPDGDAARYVWEVA